jgi:hypothetical protein
MEAVPHQSVMFLGSSGFAGLPGDEATQAFNALLEIVTTPLVEVFYRSAETLLAADGIPSESPADSPRTEVTEAAVLPPNASCMYLINCLLAVWSPLSLHRVCSAQATSLKAMIDTEVWLLHTVHFFGLR